MGEAFAAVSGFAKAIPHKLCRPRVRDYPTV